MELAGIPLAQLVLMGGAMMLRAERQAEANEGRPGASRHRATAVRKERALDRQAARLAASLAAR